MQVVVRATAHGRQDHEKLQVLGAEDSACSQWVSYRCVLTRTSSEAYCMSNFSVRRGLLDPLRKDRKMTRAGILSPPESSAHLLEPPPPGPEPEGLETSLRARIYKGNRSRTLALQAPGRQGTHTQAHVQAHIRTVPKSGANCAQAFQETTKQEE